MAYPGNQWLNPSIPSRGRHLRWGHPPAREKTTNLFSLYAHASGKKTCNVVYSQIRDCFNEASVATAVDAEPALTVEQRFLLLADQWQKDTQFVSSGSDLISHPNYRAIIDLKWDVVPILLEDLRRNKRFWFPALAEITGLQPFDPRDATNSRRMMEAWLQWGQRKGLISAG